MYYTFLTNNNDWGENMKVLFTADWHLGKTLNGFDLLEDQKYILDQIVDLVSKNKVDVVAIAGDIYDVSIPQQDTIKVFDDFITKIIDKLGKKIILITGNHDSYSRMRFGSNIFKKEGLYIGTIYNDKVDVVTLNDKEGDLNFYLLPYQNYHLFDDEVSNYDEMYQKLLSSIKLDKYTRNIAITHGVLYSRDQSRSLQYTDSEKVIGTMGNELVPVRKFDKFDFTSVGHLHTPQEVVKNKVIYPGSILKYSFSESEDDKSVNIVDFKGKRDLDINTVKLVPKNDLKVIKGTFQDLSTKKVTKNKNDYLKLVITDNAFVDDPFATLKKKYPNLMQIRYEKESTLTHDELLQNVSSDEVDVNNVVGLFKQFISATGGKDLNMKSEALVREIASDGLEGDGFEN